MDLWTSPRGTVLRIEALAMVAITLSFFLAAFGSCRRWSNHWIVQKGFLAAQVLSLSLGTYSIGLMQSSSVKSQMYPIWAVALLTLFGCVDPVTTYNGLDYMGPFSNTVFQLCLYCGYVLLMSVSTVYGVVGSNLAIVLLSTITFIRGFHRSLALVLPSVMREQLGSPVSPEPGAFAAGFGKDLQVPPPDHHHLHDLAAAGEITMDDIRSSFNVNDHSAMIEDVCLGYSLSRLLQRRFLGLDTPREMERKRERFESLAREDGCAAAIIDYKRSLKTIEVELAFLYEVFFTSNEFLHLYEAKSSSFWVLASFMAICFVGAETATIGTTTTTTVQSSASTELGASALVVVPTTTADLIITLVILASLALLQLVQLIRCWTSNWARVSFAYEHARKNKNREREKNEQLQLQQMKPRAWMRLKAFVVTRVNWFDRYLWQDKLGQYSIVVDGSGGGGPWWLQLLVQVYCWPCRRLRRRPWNWNNSRRRCRNEGLPRMLGMEYVGHLLGGGLSSISDGGGSTETAVRLCDEQDDVKARIAEFLGQIKSRRIGVDWSALFVKNGLGDCLECLPCYSSSSSSRHGDDDGATTPDAYAFTCHVLAWHIATCYCQLAEQEEGRSAGAAGGEDSRSGGETKNRRVAIALSRYCTYLLVSAPELLPGPSVETKRAFKGVCRPMRLERSKLMKMKAMKQGSDDHQVTLTGSEESEDGRVIELGVYWGKRLLNEISPQPPSQPSCSDHWEVLALVWVQTLLYAAPYGDVHRHMQHLSQGGEFITHIWALLYHIGIDKWEREKPAAETSEEVAAAAAAGETGEAEMEEIN